MDTHGKTLVTAAGPRMRRLLDAFSLPTFRSFAEIFGYNVLVGEIPVDGPGALKTARWAKLNFIRQALINGAEYVLWMDADAMICRYDQDPVSLLAPDAFQAFVMEMVPARQRINPNTGVWLLRRGPEALSFLDDVERIGLLPGRWADQGSVMSALGWHCGSEGYVGARPGIGSRHLEGTGWLPPGWNQLFPNDPTRKHLFDGVAVVANPHVVHFAGMQHAARWRAMAANRTALAGNRALRV